MLELRRLRILHGLAQHRTVAATAQALHLTGPAVSQHLAALEREAGVPLLEKQGRTLVFTSAGRLLLSHAEVILDDLAAAEAALRAASEDGGVGTVRLAAFASAARNLLPGAWADVRRKATAFLHLRELEPDAALELLQHREIDIAVVHSYTLLPRELPIRCEEHRLLDEPVVLVLPRATAEQMRVADGELVDLTNFGDRQWLVPTVDLSCYEMIHRACGAAGFVPTIVAEAADFAVLTALAGAGAGVTLVPAMALPSNLEGVTVHPLLQPVRRNVFALTRPGASRRPDIRSVLDSLGQAAIVYAETSAVG